MMNRLGGLRVSERSSEHILLQQTRPTHAVGALLVAVGALSLVWMWGWGPRILLLAPLLVAFLGVLMVTLEREIRVDRSAGTVEIRQSIFGMGRRSIVPLFHFRAVVISASPSSDGLKGRDGHYTVLLDRRVGTPIYVDEDRHCADLMTMAEAIADVAELRLEYDATNSL